MGLKIKREGSVWFLCLVIATGLFLRLVWVEDMEWKRDEQYMYEKAHEVVNTGRLPAVGMMSGGDIVNPGLSLGVFSAIALFTHSPISMCRVVQVINILGILLFLAFALVKIGPEEREVWLWGIALASVNPLAVVFSRKIWAQDLLPFFAFWVILGNACRRKGWGAFLWGFAGAVIGQVHMSGFFFAAGLLVFTLSHDCYHKIRFQWKPWLVGALAGGVGIVPWAIYIAQHPQSPEQSISHVFHPYFYPFWLLDAHGLDIAYSMRGETWEFIKEPFIAGVPTYLIALLHLFLAGVVLCSLVRIAKRLKSGVRRLREKTALSGLFADVSAARFYLLSVLLGLGVFMTLSGVKVRLHYLICAFPFSYIFLVRMYYPRKTLLQGVIVAQLIITVSFLTYVHRHGGVLSGDYGRTFRSSQQLGY